MQSGLLKQVCRNYQGQAAKVHYVRVATVCIAEGEISGCSKEANWLFLKVSKPYPEDTFRRGVRWQRLVSGLRAFSNRKIHRIVTPDGKVWES